MLFDNSSCLNQVHAVIGVLMDDTDPLVTVMKVEKAPQETYADIGGLDNQIQEIKVIMCANFCCSGSSKLSYYDESMKE